MKLQLRAPVLMQISNSALNRACLGAGKAWKLKCPAFHHAHTNSSAFPEQEN